MFREGNTPSAYVQVLYHLQLRELDAPICFHSSMVRYVQVTHSFASFHFSDAFCYIY